MYDNIVDEGTYSNGHGEGNEESMRDFG